MNELAPIGISTYSRLEHLTQTIESLKNNSLAEKSDLYIFSDAPRKGDEVAVERVRNYINNITGFKKVHVINRATNSRVKNSRGGLKMLLDKYGKAIFLEEDIVTSPGFLEFMNQALDFYKNDNRILSITGYSPPIEINEKDIEGDSFILQRFTAWGFATWKEKFDPFSFNLNTSEVEMFLKSKKQIKQFIQNGDDMIFMLKNELRGKLDALDVKVMFYEFQHNLFTLYPKKSLVHNIGNDGSGLHCGTSNKFDVSLWTKGNEFKFIENIQLNKKVVNANKKFRKLSLKRKLIKGIRQTVLYQQLKRRLRLNLDFL